jgi:transcriptional regulator with XRE-family HTH domain
VLNVTGRILKSLRELKGVTMDEMSIQLKQYNVSPSKSMISRWEAGKAEPSMEYARILAKYFNVSLDYLLGLESEKEKDNDINVIAAHAISKLNEEQIKKVIEFAKFIKSQENDKE